MPSEDTIVALGSPAGQSAIGLIRLSGPDCKALIYNIFLNSSPRPRHATLGEYRDAKGRLLDQVVYIYYAREASYTGEEMIEISAHGNPLIIQKIIEDCLSRGCRMAEAGEFTRTAFLNGRMDLSQAEAVAELISASSDRALEAAQRQLRGAVGEKVNSLTDKLLQIIAQLEAYIDFPEEDLPPEEAEEPVRDLKELREEMEQLIGASHYRSLLQDGVKTVILGAPNAGKSSLMNALSGEERVIVSEEPGTTRDFVEQRIMLGPWLLRLIDTAGLHPPQSSVEERGIKKTREQAATADLRLLVLDAGLPPPSFSEEITSRLSKERSLLVVNKIDLHQEADFASFLPDLPRCRCSALTGEGLNALKEQILQTLEHDVFIPGEDRLLVSARHAHALESARAFTDKALEKLQAREYSELAASDLRGALDALGQITGKIDNEQVLDKLFSAFCIGK